MFPMYICIFNDTMQNQKGDTCQCCLLRTSYMHLETSMQLGKPNTYAEMLKECYGFKVQTFEKSKGICIICIKKLREAYQFKLQVIASQSSLEHRYSTLHNSDANKKKIKDESNSDEETENDDISMDSSILLKDLKEEENTINETNIKSMESGRASNSKLKVDVHTKNEFKTKDKSKSRRRIRKPTKVDLLRTSQKITKQKVDANILNIIKNTNCTPFFGRNLTGILCYYCRQGFEDLHQLKSHTRTKHSLKDFQTEKNLSLLNLKVDITDLKCTICNVQTDDIASATRHLTDQHKLTFHKDVPNYIQEFRLPSDGVFQCTSCNSKFETFKTLLQHMNNHYRNHVCQVCDAGFFNYNGYRAHRVVHSTESHKCRHCDKAFPTIAKRNYHEQTHTGRKRHWVCPHCGLDLGYDYLARNRHLKQEHNISAADYNCGVCGKTFLIKAKLTTHVKKYHMLEKNQACELCDYSCFDKKMLQEHMVKHTGEKRYKCDVCHKAYTRRGVLREHMRIHNNDRRHVCHVCPSAFVQKCSLKSHLLSHHSMSLEENEQLNLDSK